MNAVNLVDLHAAFRYSREWRTHCR